MSSALIDPRRHDAVLFDATLNAPDFLTHQLQEAGVLSARGNGRGDLIEAATRLRTQPGRCVVIAADPTLITAARDRGFALIIGVNRADPHDALRHTGADALVADLAEVSVRTGDQRMSQLPDAGQAFDLINREPLVCFDFDGTLSEIVDDPDTATLVAGVPEALQKLAAHCQVAILSGRDLADVTERVGLPGVWYAGSHGFELTAPDGTHQHNAAATATIPILERVAVQLGERFASFSGVALEHKRFGVAVHYRNAARDRIGEVSAAVRAAGQRHALRVTTGREVIELRPDIDWDKGKTLRWIIDHLGSAQLVTPIYLGDDITDEDAFDAVRAPDLQGIPILVRHNEDGDRATAALFALDGPARVRQFVDELARRL